MPLLGTGAVAIWHDIAPEGRDEFYAWHGEEHMPERVAIPGFLRGRRYVAIRAGLEFFNLYEAQSHAIVTGPDYQHRLNNPTPWTRATVRHFHKVARAICKVGASFGELQAGLIGTFRYDVPDEQAEEHQRVLSEKLLPDLRKVRGIAGAHLLVADVEASAVDTTERKVRAEQNEIPRWIVLVEGWGDETRFNDACLNALPDIKSRTTGVNSSVDFGLYRLQASLDKSAPSGPR